MSRVGRKPIPLPANVKVDIRDGRLEAKGPRGALAVAVPANLKGGADTP